MLKIYSDGTLFPSSVFAIWETDEGYEIADWTEYGLHCQSAFYKMFGKPQGKGTIRGFLDAMIERDGGNSIPVHWLGSGRTPDEYYGGDFSRAAIRKDGFTVGDLSGSVR